MTIGWPLPQMKKDDQPKCRRDLEGSPGLTEILNFENGNGNVNGNGTRNGNNGGDNGDGNENRNVNGRGICGTVEKMETVFTLAMLGRYPVKYANVLYSIVIKWWNSHQENHRN
ncbi:hypothetical protein Tco_1211149 [Tanacetum coccineum]